MRIWIPAGLCVCLLAVGAAGVAWSAIPASNGTITGCFTKGGGPLRVVKAASACNPSTENVLQWNQGASGFDLTVPMTTSTGSVLITNTHGLGISYSCSVTGSSKEGTITFDPGASGQATLQGQQRGPLIPGGPVMLTAKPVTIGQGISPNPTGAYEMSGTVIATTTTDVISLVVYERVDYDASTCTYRGTITAAPPL